MTIIKQMIWNGMNTKQDQAIKLADYVNLQLSVNHRVELVKVTDSWFMMIGSVQAKAVFDKMATELKAKYPTEEKKEFKAKEVA